MKTLPLLKVVVDTRENDPLLFPDTLLWYPGPKRATKPTLFKIEVIDEALDRGDYAIKGYEDYAGGERKRVLELAANLFTEDAPRFNRAWARFLTLPHKFLIVDTAWKDLYKPSRYFDHPEQAIDTIQRLAVEHGVSILYGGNASSVKDRKRFGGEVARVLWNAVYLEHRRRELEALRPQQGASNARDIQE